MLFQTGGECSQGLVYDTNRPAFLERDLGGIGYEWHLADLGSLLWWYSVIWSAKERWVSLMQKTLYFSTLKFVD